MDNNTYRINIGKICFLFIFFYIKIESAEKLFFIVIAKLRRSCGNLNADGFEITTSFCFRKTPHDDILI